MHNELPLCHALIVAQPALELAIVTSQGCVACALRRVNFIIGQEKSIQQSVYLP